MATVAKAARRMAEYCILSFFGGLVVGMRSRVVLIKMR